MAASLLAQCAMYVGCSSFTLVGDCVHLLWLDNQCNNGEEVVVGEYSLSQQFSSFVNL